MLERFRGLEGRSQEQAAILDCAARKKVTDLVTIHVAANSSTLC